MISPPNFLQFKKINFRKQWVGKVQAAWFFNPRFTPVLQKSEGFRLQAKRLNAVWFQYA
jgi:hypothetical protein